VQCKDSRGVKKGIESMEAEYLEDNPDHENCPFNHGSVHGKRDYA